MICFLRKRFLFFILSTLLALTTQNSVYGQMENACIASDAVPSTRIIETDLGLNQITPGEVVEFRLSCKGELRLSVGISRVVYSIRRKYCYEYTSKNKINALSSRRDLAITSPRKVYRNLLSGAFYGK